MIVDASSVRVSAFQHLWFGRYDTKHTPTPKIASQYHCNRDNGLVVNEDDMVTVSDSVQV
jgi:hypothetical protein